MKTILMKLAGLKHIYATHIARKLQHVGVSTEGIRTFSSLSAAQEPAEQNPPQWYLELPVQSPQSVSPAPCRIRKAYGFKQNNDAVALTIMTPEATLPIVSISNPKQVKDLMSRSVSCIRSQMPIHQVLAFCLEHRLHQMPVVDQDLRFQGMFSMDSVFNELYEQMQSPEPTINFWDRPAVDFLCAKDMAVLPETHLEQAAAVMRQYRLRQICVVNKKFQLKGLLHAEAFLQYVSA